jgi:hypothetical protein
MSLRRLESKSLVLDSRRGLGGSRAETFSGSNLSGL